MDANCVVECLDIFKDKRVRMMEVLNLEPVKPLALDQRVEGFDASIVIRITFMTVTELKLFCGFTISSGNVLASAIRMKN